MGLPSSLFWVHALSRVGLCLLPLVTQAEPDFGRDILPLLSDRCFLCHGPDASSRKAGLRLDLEAEAKSRTPSERAIVAGDREASALWSRITSQDDSERMPPPDSGKPPLTSRELALIGQWIDTGAPWGRHWSFEAPTRPAVPNTAAHPIDAFIRAKAASDASTPPWNPKADARTRLRRAAFVLTGMPPEPEWIDALDSEDTQENWARVVERLLDSPGYGERMAMWWLDAARYADTDGYQQDATRSQWPWRDWVMDSFNANQPFDRFTVEQIAGDLIEDRDDQSQLATAFHRNHLANGEGGRDPEESRVDYVIDRVNTTGAVWLGLTLGCAQCHDHKFDPISQRDYYAFSGFFNSIDEDGRAGAGAQPILEITSPYAPAALREAEGFLQSRTHLREQAAQAAEDRFQAWLADTVSRPPTGSADWQSLEISDLRSVEGTHLASLNDASIVASGPHPRQDDYVVTGRPATQRVAGIRLEILPHSSHTDGRYTRGASGDFILTDFKVMLRRAGDARRRDLKLDSAIADRELKTQGRRYGRIADTLDDDPRNGWTVDGDAGVRTAIYRLATPITLGPDDQLVCVLLQRSTVGDANIGRFRLSTVDAPKPDLRSLEPLPRATLQNLLPIHPTDVPPDLVARLRTGFLDEDPTWQAIELIQQRAKALVDERRKQSQAQTVLVLKEREEQRPTHILERGVWDAKGAVVSPNVPVRIGPRPSSEEPDRRDLAHWITAEDNPLTARVVANHLWTLAFGQGLVRTPEDFGLQGERPTHPELLDWLAVEFVESGWNVKGLLRLMLTSDAFQRSSAATTEAIEADPENRMWTRANRYRWPSWMLRDQALAAAELLNPAVGGPPTRPYQPDGVWREQFMGRFTYIPNVGPAQYRRSLYAFWRRTSAPTFLFDSAQRQVCEVRLRRTNTPLHALTLLNDATMLESALALALMVDGEEAPERELFQRILQRAPQPEEGATLRETRKGLIEEFQRAPHETRAFLKHGQTDARGHPRPAETAANLAIASLLLNLDETLTHE